MQRSVALTLLTLSFALSACTTTQQKSTSQPQQQAPATTAPSESELIRQCAESGSLYTLNAVLWQQSAVEYRAAATQTYVNARMMLDRALADPTWTALPNVAIPADAQPAIALDLDETAFDNSAYQARLLKLGIVHSEDEFNKFEAEAAGEAVPGATEFLQYAKSKGVKVFYITNRDDLVGGKRLLERLGYPVDEDTMLFKTTGLKSDKTSRREWVASHYRLLLLLGDDFNDFVLAGGKTLAERNALWEQNKAMFGVKWFMISNAMYGSWENAITAGARTLEEKCAAKFRVLRTEGSRPN